MKWFRGVFSAVFVGGITYGFIAGMIPWAAYMGAALLAVGWWYKERDKEKGQP
jgi:hypothetical protein